MAGGTSTNIRKNAPSLPKQQLAILALCRFAEPVAMTSVYPYIPEMVKSFGTPTNAVAKYAGLLSLVFSLSQALTGIAWGSLSDRVGRKPSIVLALTCTMVSSVMFGCSTSLSMAFISRSLQGLSNGNVGIIRTAVAELVPQKELQPRAFSIMPLVWTIGSIFGPSIGGTLVHPVERFPALFSKIHFLRTHPFALPNLLISLLFLIGIASGILFLRETLEDRKDRRDYGLVLGSLLTRPCSRRHRSWHRKHISEYDDSATPFLADTSAPPSPVLRRRTLSDVQHEPTKQPSQWSLVFTYQSNLNLLVYTFLAMHSVSFDQLLPVFLDYSPVRTIDSPNTKLPFKFNGGFDLDSGRIGAIFTCYGIFGMIIQFAVFPPLVRKYGALNCYKCIAVTFPVVYILVPYVSLFRTSTQRQVMLVMLMLIKGFCSIFAFPCSTILLTNSAASLKILGTLNGVATSISALGRAAGPALAGWTFSVGADEGYILLPWWTLALIAMIGAIPAWWLVEMDGFGGDESDDDIAIDSEDSDEGDDTATTSALAPSTAITINAAEGASNIALLPADMPHLSPTTSRGSAGRPVRQQKDSLTSRRLHSPIGMGGEGLARGMQRRYSTDLGTTLSGHGSGGTSYH